MSDASDKAINEFFDEIMKVPWGSMSKTQLETLVFILLVDTGKISFKTANAKNLSNYELAMLLQITPMKAKTLRYRFEQQKLKDRKLDFSVVIEKADINFEPDDKNHAFVQIENGLYADFLRNRLKEHASVTWTYPGSDVLKVNRNALKEVLEEESLKFANNKKSNKSQNTRDTYVKMLDGLFDQERIDQKKETPADFIRKNINKSNLAKASKEVSRKVAIASAGELLSMALKGLITFA
ncbi:hypothetical protein [Bifidobacterium sp. ESL0790]|uniref:hypothetical protein n=1 Tax=Bifidobacterium sp. ESL0790 TaxID=2983233 RepID=UPI0023F73E63|nr:hypothetical protein [Bifidobacterium sp. ESL0790]WEV73134.1 hypothetical protein OZY47_04100 [Bifidobacterium sp. ESL0790]